MTPTGKAASCRQGKRGKAEKCAARPVGPSDLGDMWARFRRSRTARSRNPLVEKYMPLVRAISGRLAAELPHSVRVEDLVSAGTFGLMDAIERYDTELGTRFESYCAVRIRGAILDELRHLNWVPRMQCSRAARVDAAVAELRGELGHIPTPKEVARKTGLKLAEVRSTRGGDHRHLSLTDGPAGGEAGAMRHIDVIEAENVCDPASVLQEKEQRDILAGEVRKLPAPERLLVMLYYFDELTMKQIGKVLDVTESRVCQMHAEILARLQQRLSEFNESSPDRG